MDSLFFHNSASPAEEQGEVLQPESDHQRESQATYLLDSLEKEGLIGKKVVVSKK